MHRQSAVLPWFLALAVAGTCRPAASAEPDVLLRKLLVSGAPGETVTLDFRATVLKPFVLFSMEFNIPSDVAEFVGADIEGTACAHGDPQGIVYDPAFWKGGYRIGMRLDTSGRYEPASPGEDIIVIKGLFKIRAGAPAGDHAIRLTNIEFTGRELIEGIRHRIFAMQIESEGDGVFRVSPPSGPRPVDGLQCSQSGKGVSLTWTLTEAYDGLLVSRNGQPLDVLPGTAVSLSDEPDPGPTVYSIVAFQADSNSVPATCSILVQVPRPPPVHGYTCGFSQVNGTVLLGWTNGAAYDSITLYRNGQVLAELEGSASYYEDPWSSDLFTTYTLQASLGGVDSLPVSCRLNETSDVFVIWAEDVRAEPGAAGVAVRLFCTNPKDVRGIDVGLRIDPTAAAIRRLSLDGTASQAALADFFLYQDHVLDTGETRAGIGFDFAPPFGHLLPRGADQHFLTAFVDLLPGAPPRIPVEIGAFGSPPGDSMFILQPETGAAYGVKAETRSGLILVGASPVPEVEGARAEIALAEPLGHGLGAGAQLEGGGGGGGGGANEAGGDGGGGGDLHAQPPGPPRLEVVPPPDLVPEGIRLSWTNGAAYSAIRIERDAKLLAEIAGDSTSYLDSSPGPGIHRYRIVAIQGDRESFPAVVTTLPAGVPGTFRRGDADSDNDVDLTDAIVVLLHLFRGGSQPACLDAADANDDGALNLTDAIALLHHLFRGTGELPMPGTQAAWFDPTPDDLTCE